MQNHSFNRLKILAGINEGMPTSSRAPMYHFTSVALAQEILKTNRIGGYHEISTSMGTRKIKIGTVSLTRDKNLWQHGYIRFELDKEKLQQKFKLNPRADLSVRPKYDRNQSDLMKDRPWFERRWESEETVRKPISPLDHFLIEIKLHQKAIDHLLKVHQTLTYVIDHSKINIKLIQKGQMLPDRNHPWYIDDDTPVDIPDNPRAKRRHNLEVYQEQLDRYYANVVTEYNEFVTHPKLNNQDKSTLSKYYPIPKP